MTGNDHDPSAGDRPTVLRDIAWANLVAPKVVAVVGASDREGTPGRQQFVQLRQRLEAAGAQVVPVHPTKSEILGTAAYPNVSAIPDHVNLAVIMISDPLDVIAECLAKGVDFAVVFSAGFAEVGTAEGREATSRLAELARGTMRILGPNTNMNIFEGWREDLPGGKLAILTQSGHQGRPIAQGEALGIAIQVWATLGNEADLEFADFVGYLARMPDTSAIAGYVEGFTSGRTLMLAADIAAQRRVPILLIKVGRSDAGRQMAQAHTGHLTGSDAVHDAVFRQTGIIRLDDLDEIIEISGMFCHTSRLRPGRRGTVAIYALSGGTASHMVDLISAAGLEVPRLSDATVKELGEYIPWYLRSDNPVDGGGILAARPEGRRVLELILDDENIDVMVVPITGVFPGMSDVLARNLVAIHARGAKPVIAIWSSPRRDDDGYRSLIEGGVPLFHSFTAATRGIRAWVDHSRFTADYQSPFTGRDLTASEPNPIATLATAGEVHTGEVLSILDSYGIEVAPGRVVSTVSEAQEWAAARSCPRVALKVASSDIPHRSEFGLVELVANDPASVSAAFERLRHSVRRAFPEIGQCGVLLQDAVDDGVAEVILGISHQPPFGPTVLIGLGGVFVEVFKDVAMHGR
jgi:acyl-CoA synthetase (NDP forming)